MHSDWRGADEAASSATRPPVSVFCESPLLRNTRGMCVCVCVCVCVRVFDNNKQTHMHVCVRVCQTYLLLSSCRAIQGLLGREWGMGKVLSMRLDVHEASTPSPPPKREDEEPAEQAEEHGSSREMNPHGTQQHVHTHTIIHAPPPHHVWSGARYHNNNLVDSKNPGAKFFGAGGGGGGGGQPEQTRAANVAALNKSWSAFNMSASSSSQLSVACTHEFKSVPSNRPALSAALSKLDIGSNLDIGSSKFGLSHSALSPLHSFSHSVAAALKHESASLGAAGDTPRSAVISVRRNMHVARGGRADLGEVNDLTSSFQSELGLGPLGSAQVLANGEARRTLAALRI